MQSSADYFNYRIGWRNVANVENADFSGLLNFHRRVVAKACSSQKISIESHWFVQDRHGQGVILVGSETLTELVTLTTSVDVDKAHF